MDPKFCQSCAMPIDDPNAQGTNADGTKSEEYCVYCFENGQFTQDVTMEGMIEISVSHMAQMGMDEEESREKLKTFFPELKRWKQI